MALRDNIVEIFRLAKFGVQAGVGIDAANGRDVGTAFVDGDFLRQAVQIDGALDVAFYRSQVTLGSEKEVHRITRLFHCAVQIFPHWPETFM